MINESGKLHMVPALLNELYVIRFAICSQSASEADVEYAWDVISAFASELLAGRRESATNSDRLSKESASESDDEVFNTDFDDEFIFDHQRCHLQRAHLKRNFFFKMVSDPKSYNPRVLRSLSGRHRSHSVGSSSPGSGEGAYIGQKPVTNGAMSNGTPP